MTCLHAQIQNENSYFFELMTGIVSVHMYMDVHVPNPCPLVYVCVWCVR